MGIGNLLLAPAAQKFTVDKNDMVKGIGSRQKISRIISRHTD